jgi:hypothetical protein
MRMILIAFSIAGMLAVPSVVLSAAFPVSMGSSSVTVEHGGGCRKSSPPGQCCHMDNSQGRVHCH